MQVKTPIRERTFAAVLLATLYLPLLASGQTTIASSADGFSVKRREQKVSPLEALQEFERYSPATYSYGEGDEVVLDVFGHPELSGKHTIGPDGEITLPVAGSVHLADLSREQALRLVQDTYGKLYAGLSIVIRTEVYGSNRIFILGRVASPGVLHFDTPPTLLEAITRAGSLPVGGIGADKAAMDRCAIFRGRDAVVWIDLKPLLKEGNLAYNLRLKRNDIIYMPDSDDQSIFVLGEVDKPGAYHLRPDMTFMEAFAGAGGATKDGVTNKMQLIRPSKQLVRSISLTEVMRPDPGLNFSLADGDIIYVPRRGLAKFGYFVQQFGPASGLAIVGKQIGP